ncbi:hypothetical protein BDV96DRAFT_568953 [Lophiotrema nucula]|uniref:Uncharacterized protein n=1 Tax=Lophiotrema nucula TaxID=690887 RepID=A0A6A5ZJP4_9PLEO|nr:hypothetical protein BDV96DRAFT_568953 [Lophiotrema nucula]
MILPVMDPLAITTTVISISARCVRSARALYELCGKYKDASMTITAIYSETTVISTSLAHIQALCTKNPDALRSTLSERSDLEHTFDQALTGCVLVYSVIDDEVQRLYSGIGTEGMTGAMSKMKLLWKEDAMKDVLVQIRGQQQALSLLIQALQMNSIHEIRTLIQNNTAVLQGVAQRTSKFRQANPRIKAPRSVFEVTIDDAASLYSVDSVATSTNFFFDDQVVNSAAYRRILAQSRTSLTPVKEQSEHATDSGAETVVNFPEELAQKYTVPPEIRGRLTPATYGVLLKWVDDMVGAYTKGAEEETKQVVEEKSALAEKYAKVKRCFFEVKQDLENQVRERETLAAEYGRATAEKEEVERTKSALEEMVASGQKFFAEVEEKRKAVSEAHAKEIRIKSRSVRNAIEYAENLKVTERAQMERICELQMKCTSEQVKHSKISHELYDCQSELEKMHHSHAELEDHIQQYKAYEPIIEQLKLLSPALSPSLRSPSTAVQESLV